VTLCSGLHAGNKQWCYGFSSMVQHFNFLLLKDRVSENNSIKDIFSELSQGICVRFVFVFVYDLAIAI